MKAVFTPPNIILLRISRSHFKQSKTPQLISLVDVLGCCKFFGDFLGYQPGMLLIWVQLSIGVSKIIFFHLTIP